MADEEAEQYKELLHWAAAQGITDTPPDQDLGPERQSSCLGFSLQVATYPDAGGRGLAAARDLKLGDLILRVPEKALMNGRSARQDAELARALSLYPALSPVQVLCVHLLREVAKARTSAWYPYLVHLPRIHHTAAHYTPFEAQALQVEDAVWMAERAAENAHGEWVGARPVMEKLGLGRRFTSLHAWLWASATVSSRTLFVPWDEAGTLCPIGDYFNYACPGVSYGAPDAIPPDGEAEESQDTSHCLEIRDRLRDGGFEPERGEYCFYARQDYQRGQQVLLCYGTYTNLELLEHYGFLLSFNPNDKAPMGLPNINELGPADSLVSPETVPSESLYIDHEGKPSFSLLSHLRLMAAPVALRKTRRHLALAGQQISQESDVASYEWLESKCRTISTSLATSAHADAELFAVIKAGRSVEEVRNLENSHNGEFRSTGWSGPELVQRELEAFVASVTTKGRMPRWEEDLRFERWKLAVEWRLGYKTILDRCISYCAKRLREINS